MFSKKVSASKDVEAKHLHGSVFQHKKVFVVVAGISTGRHIAPLLRGYGYDVVHVESQLATQLGILHQPSDYIDNLKEGNNLQELIEALSQYDIQAIIPGAEAGVKLADILNEHFKLPTRNDFSKTNARQNKFLMQDAIKKEGIASANQIRTDNLQELLKWVNYNGYPIVLKPENSAGTDNVHFCYNENDVKNFFAAIINGSNIYGNQNQYVVAQEMLMGDEFMVNTVSYGDDICVSDIIAVKKKMLDNAPLYDYSYLLSPQDPRFKEIFEYVSKVLKALGFYYGAAHTEVILTNRGPVLVEVNARLTGAYDMAATTEAIGRNQVSVLVKSHIREGSVARQSQKEKIHPRRTLTSFFIAENDCKVENSPDLSFLQNNPLVFSIKFGHPVGSTIPKTTSLMNSPGMVNFVGDNESDLLQSHTQFREHEKDFFKKIANK